VNEEHVGVQDWVGAETEPEQPDGFFVNDPVQV
jgi:hypothetical protein